MRLRIVAAVWTGMVLTAGLCGCADGQLGTFPAVGAAPPPDNANVTILLCYIPGPNHVAESETYRNTIAQTTGWRDVHVVHKDEWSELYRGRYLSLSQAQRDLKSCRAWRDSRGVLPFARAIVMPLPPKDVGPAEWNLLRTRGAVTVAIAEFYDVPESGYVGRRDFAVQCCRQLRDEGHEAYYYHGPVKSFVCIGSFPESSYPSVNEGGMAKRVVRDARIEAILKRFPFLAVNGRQDIWVVQIESGKPARLAANSYVMDIPR